jgi:hypothetical protein
MPRPVEYVGELEQCAITNDGKVLTFNPDSECFKALQAKYRDYSPTDDDKRRVETEFKKQTERMTFLAPQRPAKATEKKPLLPSRPCGCGASKRAEAKPRDSFSRH